MLDVALPDEEDEAEAEEEAALYETLPPRLVAETRLCDRSEIRYRPCLSLWSSSSSPCLSRSSLRALKTREWRYSRSVARSITDFGVGSGLVLVLVLGGSWPMLLLLLLSKCSPTSLRSFDECNAEEEDEEEEISSSNPEGCKFIAPNPRPLNRL